MGVFAKSVLHKSLRQAFSVLDGCGVVLRPFPTKSFIKFSKDNVFRYIPLHPRNPPETVPCLVYRRNLPRRTFLPCLKLRRLSSVNSPCFNYGAVQNISWLKRLRPWRCGTPWKLLEIIFAKPQ